jgi:hypothetical protein
MLLPDALADDDRPVRSHAPRPRLGQPISRGSRSATPGYSTARYRQPSTSTAPSTAPRGRIVPYLDQARRLRRRWPGVSAALCLGGPRGARRATTACRADSKPVHTPSGHIANSALSRIRLCTCAATTSMTPCGRGKHFCYAEQRR